MAQLVVPLALGRLPLSTVALPTFGHRRVYRNLSRGNLTAISKLFHTLVRRTYAQLILLLLIFVCLVQLAYFILLVTAGFQIHKSSVPRALSSAGSSLRAPARPRELPARPASVHAQSGRMGVTGVRWDRPEFETETSWKTEY